MVGKNRKKQFDATIIDEVLQMKSAGRTYREIAEHFGFARRNIIKNLVERHNRRQRQIEDGIISGSTGWPRRTEKIGEDVKDARIR